MAYEMACYNRDYAKFYTDLNDGRTALTVGELKKRLADLPAEMPVKVSHQYDRHPVGIQDPLIGAHDIMVTVAVRNSMPVMGPADPPLQYFIFE